MDQCVVKGGSSCVIGGISLDGIALGVHAQDYLLHKFLDHDGYKRVVVVAIERSHVLLKSLAQHSKIVLVSTMQEAMTAMTSLDTEERTSCACVVYSGTAVLLNKSDLSSSGGVKYLATVMNSLRKMKMETIVMLFHRSMHTPSTIAKIKTQFVNIVDIVPNVGTLSENIFGVCTTIRTSHVSFSSSSHVTRKVSENEEYLVRKEIDNYNSVGINKGTNDALLVLAPFKPDGKTQNNQDKTGAYMNDDSIDLNIRHKENDKVDTDTDTDTGTGTDAHPPASTSAGFVSRSQRSQPLITFDKADPEWDEDSDPDGDLDL
jgi:hypothetical protein